MSKAIDWKRDYATTKGLACGQYRILNNGPMIEKVKPINNSMIAPHAVMPS